MASLTPEEGGNLRMSASSRLDHGPPSQGERPYRPVAPCRFPASLVSRIQLEPVSWAHDARPDVTCTKVRH
jgi:hypothetical protein